MSDEKKESRINIEDLPAPEKELSAEEARQVQGGAWHELVILGDVAAVKADGSVKPQGYNTKGDPVAR